MIIWINGAFGAGKTQTAYELERRIPHAYVYDPENIGFFLGEYLPKEIQKEDFQDYEIWRELNYTTLKYLAGEYNGTIIVPMTIVNPVYFNEIIGELRNDGVRLEHFVLWASKETLQMRLEKRGEEANAWCVKQIDRCMEGLSNEIFEGEINTDKMRVEHVAEAIIAACRRSGMTF